MTGGTPTSTVAEYYENGTVPWLVSGDIHGFEIWNCEKRITQAAVENSNARVLPKDSVLIALNGQGRTRGTVALLRMEGATCNQSLVAITPSKPERVIPEFIFWTLRSMYSDIRSLTGDNERSGLNIPLLKSIRIPLPPLDVQKEIVAEIEGYQSIINGARTVLDSYRPYIPIHPDWPILELGQLIESKPKNGYSGSPVDHPTNLKVLSLSATTSGTRASGKAKSRPPRLPLLFAPLTSRHLSPLCWVRMRKERPACCLQREAANRCLSGMCTGQPVTLCTPSAASEPKCCAGAAYLKTSSGCGLVTQRKQSPMFTLMG